MAMLDKRSFGIARCLDEMKGGLGQSYLSSE